MGHPVQEEAPTTSSGIASATPGESSEPGGDSSLLRWAILQLCPRAEGGFLLPEDAQTELTERLEDLELPAGDVKEGAWALLGLSITLERRHGSPEASGAIRQALAESPRAVAALGILGDSSDCEDRVDLGGSDRRTSAHRAFLPVAPSRAPSIRDLPPEGSIPVARLLKPADSRGSRPLRPMRPRR